jgi:hypothetical protein
MSLIYLGESVENPMVGYTEIQKITEYCFWISGILGEMGKSRDADGGKPREG